VDHCAKIMPRRTKAARLALVAALLHHCTAAPRHVNCTSGGGGGHWAARRWAIAAFASGHMGFLGLAACCCFCIAGRGWHCRGRLPGVRRWSRARSRHDHLHRRLPLHHDHDHDHHYHYHYRYLHLHHHRRRRTLPSGGRPLSCPPACLPPWSQQTPNVFGGDCDAGVPDAPPCP
jgi:hypothetical protein